MIREDAERFPPVPATLKNGVIGIIRPLSLADGEVLAAFYASIPTKIKRFYFPHPLDREHALRNAAKAESPLEVVLILKVPGGKLVGYAWYRWDDAGAERSTFGICLAPGYQGLGAGSQLMARLLEIAREVGPPTMSLAVQVENPRALALYRKMGFDVVRDMRLEHHPSSPCRSKSEYYYYMERRAR
ncbi:MAG: GNAT family N-acetyltransferase [Armatimonadota bacterium]